MERSEDAPDPAGTPVAPEVCAPDAAPAPAAPPRSAAHAHGAGPAPARAVDAGPGAATDRGDEPVVAGLDPAARRVRADATVDGALVGTLAGRFPTPALFVADRVEAPSGAPSTATLRAFVRAAAAALAPRDGEVLVTEPGSPDGWRAAVEACGLVRRATKACVRRALDATLPTVSRSFGLRSLAEVGEAPFVARLRSASTGDPFDARADGEVGAHRAWLDLVASAGDRFDPTSWFLVDDEHGPVGVVLPQTVGAEVGTLFYVGVEPARRGQGLGTALHALGLWILANRGLRRYVGSTDERNGPMLRVFARNGCPVTERDLYFGAGPVVGAGPVAR